MYAAGSRFVSISSIFFSLSSPQINMKKSFLDYYKYVLDKVSFDQNLFNKEFQKALSKLEKQDEKKLLKWIREQGLATKLAPSKVRDRELF